MYRFRNLPCTIRPGGTVWCVSGAYEDGTSGILEWCYDQDDAEYQKAKMDLHGGFSHLRTHPYVE